ncbi:uncharacterized protein METZ01_LOCUS463171 [marine metagenome]|uniref:Uncharacterized protein n=1 Tax=marine metagenome TaxID=408172 RepID=A0A383AR68_9ZZZZ
MKPLLGGSDAEYLRATRRARALGGGLSVLHGDLLGVLNLAFASALYAIGFHRNTSHHYGRDIVSRIFKHVNI